MVQVLTKLGVNVALIEAGPMLNPARTTKNTSGLPTTSTAAALEGGMYSANPYKPFSFFSAPNGYWNIEGEPYTVAPKAANSLVPIPHHRRPHEPLRPHHTALRRLRFQAVLPRRSRHDWPITYDESPVLRQSRSVHRRHRNQRRHPERPGRHLPTASAPRVHEVLIKKSWRQARDPVIPDAHGDHHETDERPRRPATTAGSAAEVASRPRITHQARCRSSRR